MKQREDFQELTKANLSYVDEWVFFAIFHVGSLILFYLMRNVNYLDINGLQSNI